MDFYNKPILKTRAMQSHQSLGAFFLILICTSLLAASCTNDSKTASESQALESKAGQDSTPTPQSSEPASAEKIVEEGETFTPNPAHSSDPSDPEKASTEPPAEPASVEIETSTSRPTYILSTTRKLSKGLCTRLSIEPTSGSATISLNTSGEATVGLFSDKSCRTSLVPTPFLTEKSNPTHLYILPSTTGGIQFTARADGYDDGVLDATINEATWSSPVNLDSLAGVLNWHTDYRFMRANPRLVRVGANAILVYIQGQNLYTSIYSQDAQIQAALNMDDAGGTVTEFDLVSGPEEEGIALLTWIQRVPTEGTTGVTKAFARIYQSTTGWGSPIHLSGSGKNASEIKSAISTSAGAWIAWKETTPGSRAASQIRASRLAVDSTSLESDIQIAPELSTKNLSYPLVLLGTGSSTPRIVFVSVTGSGSSAIYSLLEKSGSTLAVIAALTSQNTVGNLGSNPLTPLSVKCEAGGASVSSTPEGSFFSICTWQSAATDYQVHSSIWNGTSWSASTNIFGTAAYGKIIPGLALSSGGIAWVTAAFLNESNRQVEIKWIKSSTIDPSSSWNTPELLPYPSGNGLRTSERVSAQFHQVTDTSFNAIWFDTTNRLVKSAFDGTTSTSIRDRYVTTFNLSRPSSVQFADGSILLAHSLIHTTLLPELKITRLNAGTSMTNSELKSTQSENGIVHSHSQVLLSLGDDSGIRFVSETLDSSTKASKVSTRTYHASTGFSEPTGTQLSSSTALTGISSSNYIGGYSPQIAQDSAGNQLVVYAERSRARNSSGVLVDSYQIFSRRKANDASSWDIPAKISIEDLSRYPRITLKMNSQGDAVVVWHNGVNAPGFNYYQATGETAGWQDASPIVSHILADAEFNPNVQITPSGDAFVTYRTNINRTSSVNVIELTSVRYEAGKGWAEAEIIPGTLGAFSITDFDGIQTLLDPTGNLAVCFLAVSLNCTVRLASGGWLATPQVIVVPSERAPTTLIARAFDMVVDPTGKFTVAYLKTSDRKVYAKSFTIAGTAIAVETSESTLSSEALPSEYNLYNLVAASDAQGNHFVAWGLREYAMLSSAAQSHLQHEIRVARFSGGSWQTPQIVDLGTGAAILKELHVSVSGEALLTWTQPGEDTGYFLKAALFDGH